MREREAQREKERISPYHSYFYSPPLSFNRSQVPDVEPAAFLAMLRYLYCDEVALESDNVLATLYCAKRYIIPHLAQE